MRTTRAQHAETARLDLLTRRGHWEEPRLANTLALDANKYLSFLSQVCVPHKNDYGRLPRTISEATDGYYLANGWFQAVDAEVLYSVVRHFKPQSIIEVGSGFSTRLMRQAIADGALNTRLRCVDPDPRVDIGRYCDEHTPRKVEELDPTAVAQSLFPGDILFIDSSHAVKTGGDVPYLFLEVIPRLSPGVLIHVHDIFLPFDYPREWVVLHRWGWNEEYLVEAFLYGNNSIEILWPAHWMWRSRKNDVMEVIPADYAQVCPSSLWLKKAHCGD